MKFKLESRLPGEISITSDMQMTPPLWQKARRNSLSKKVKESRVEKLAKNSIRKTKIMASGPITPWQIDREKIETVTNFILGGIRPVVDVTGDRSKV